MTEAAGPECATVLGGISGYLDGELEQTECDVIERHCQVCARCAAVVRGLRETIGLCRGAVLVPIPEAVRRKAQSSIRELLKTPRS